MRFTLELDGEPRDVVLEKKNGKTILTVDGEALNADVTLEGDHVRVEVGGRTYRVAFDKGGSIAKIGSRSYELAVKDLHMGAGGAGASAGARGNVKPPMPGKIVAIKVAAGDAVKVGQVLVILEAMKMQNEIPSPVEGTVKEVHVTQGQSVEAKTVLVTIE